VFHVEAPRDKKNNCVIKVLRQWNAPHAPTQFVKGAQLNKDLCETADDQKYIVEVVDIPPHGPDQPHLAYVMTRYDDSLEGYLRKDLHQGPKAVRWAVLAAQHIGRALRAAHERERWHGDVKPSNILVDASGEDPVFRLGDFALAGPDGGDGPTGIAPRCLTERAAQHGDVQRGAWSDLCALAVVLYEMLTGKAIDRTARSMREHVVGLRELAGTARVRRNVGALRLVETLTRVFHDGEPPFDIEDFLASLDKKRTTRLPPDREMQDNGPVDVGIVTIRPDEHQAVLDRFVEAGIRTESRRYRIRRLNLGNGEAYTIGVVRCVEQGTTAALETAHALLDDLAPRLLLVVGIAGGVPHDEFSLGDVVVSNRIVDLSVEAVHKDDTRTYAHGGGGLHRSANDLVSDLSAMIQSGELDGWNLDVSITKSRPAVDLAPSNFYGHPPWKRKVLASLRRHFGAAPRPPTVTIGAIASSDRLVKNTRLVEDWMKQARQICAVEMESAGVYRAAHDVVPFLAIRGISDIVGFNRDPAWTEYACHSAAAFTRAFLRARPLAQLPPPVSRTSTTA
jgi:nucleoside phosphorylase